MPGLLNFVGESRRSVLGDDRAAELVVQLHTGDVVVEVARRHVEVAVEGSGGATGSRAPESIAFKANEKIFGADRPVGQCCPLNTSADSPAPVGRALRTGSPAADPDSCIVALE